MWYLIVSIPDLCNLITFIPSKMTKTKYSLPWIDATIKRLMKRRQKLYLRARKSNDPDVKNHYKRFRAHVQKVERDAYWRHVSNIFTFENDPSDPDSNKSGKIKKFWSFVKSLKKDAFGITSLRENGILKTDTKEKPISATGNSNLPSHVRQILTRLQKGLVHSPP